MGKSIMTITDTRPRTKPFTLKEPTVGGKVTEGSKTGFRRNCSLVRRLIVETLDNIKTVEQNEQSWGSGGEFGKSSKKKERKE